MSELTEAAKAEIAAAIRIVREDKFEQYARTTLAKHAAPPAKEEDELLTDPPKDPITPPPPKETPPKDPKEEPPKRHSAYWGEILD